MLMHYNMRDIDYMNVDVLIYSRLSIIEFSNIFLCFYINLILNLIDPKFTHIIYI